MRFAKATCCLLLVAVLAGASGPDDARKQADHVKYNQLLHKVKQIDQDYARAVRRAMQVARTNDGKADLDSMATLLSLRDQRDRTMARLTMLAMRHGWPLPESSDTLGSSGVVKSNPKEPVFQPAQQIIKTRFAEEASRLSAAVDLPVLPPPSPRVIARGPGR